MTREEAIKTLKENYCAMCAYGSQDMDSCDIRSCDNKDAIKALEQEPCEDCVSRTDVETFLDKYNFVSYDYTVEDLVKALPSVTPKIETGHWIDAESLDGTLWHTCSECGETEYYKTNYCYNCGAKMESEDKK